MKIHSRFLLLVGLILFGLASCSIFQSSTPDISQQIDEIVAATVMSLPTYAPAPTLTPYPSPTPFDLSGFFCEYKFCIGHPADISMFDLSASKNPMLPSKYDLGVIAGVSASYYIQVTWQAAPNTNDPQFMFDLILISGADTRNGNPDLKLVRGMNVVYTSITSAALNALPSGGAGVWTCGDRVFGWKAYTAQPEVASALFEEALAKFTCGQN